MSNCVFMLCVACSEFVWQGQAAFTERIKFTESQLDMIRDWCRGAGRRPLVDRMQPRPSPIFRCPHFEIEGVVVRSSVRVIV